MFLGKIHAGLVEGRESRVELDEEGWYSFGEQEQ
jgi:hypothetical protein